MTSCVSFSTSPLKTFSTCSRSRPRSTMPCKRRSIKPTVPPVPLQPIMPTTDATSLFTTSSAPPLVSLSVKEHNFNLNRTLKEWWVKNRSEWNLQNEELTEGVNYKLVVSSPPDSASLVCGRGTVIILHLHRAHYQLRATTNTYARNAATSSTRSRMGRRRTMKKAMMIQRRRVSETASAQLLHLLLPPDRSPIELQTA